jgi:Flp pilus assembly pilin Flp
MRRNSKLELFWRRDMRPDSAFTGGVTFVEILAAEREARTAIESATPGLGAEAWRDLQPGIESRPSHEFVHGGAPDVSSDEEEGDIDAIPRSKPHIVGQGMLEYALILALVAVTVIVLIGTVGHQAQDVFSNVSRGLAT